MVSLPMIYLQMIKSKAILFKNSGKILIL